MLFLTNILSLMKQLTFLLCALATSLTASAQVTTVDCDLMSLVVNIGSQPNSINLYHPGGYLTSPSSANVMHWQFTDALGALIHEVTLADENFVEFTHEVPLTDTIFVSVLLTNQEAIHNGSPVACLIEDHLTWVEVEILPGTFLGSWTLGGSVGQTATPSGIAAPLPIGSKQLRCILDAQGRQVDAVTAQQVLFFVYDDGTVVKRFVVE